MTTHGERALVARHARIMAAEISILLAVPPAEVASAEHAADACLAWLREVDSRLSRFRPASDLSRLNAAGGRWHAASDALYACVERALAAAKATDGLFDPTLLPQLEAWGYDRDFAQIAHRETRGLRPFSHPARVDSEDSPRRDRRDAPRGCSPRPSHYQAPAPWRDITLDPANRRIRLPAGVRLDLGGIAKGWAADVAVERVCSGFANVLVNVGGDLRLRGGPQLGQAWSVGLRDPRGDGSAASLPDSALPDSATLTFSRGALATSGAGRRWWLRDGVRAHHLLDPRTGAPARLWTGDTDEGNGDGAAPIATATAFAPTATRAEIAAKLALLRGYPACLAAIETAWADHGPLGDRYTPDAPDNGVALALVLADGRLILSANLPAWLATWGADAAPLYLAVNAPPIPTAHSEEASS